jgi:hypothetical protein
VTGLGYDLMMEPALGERFTLVAKLGDPGAARLSAALLDSAGIPTRLHGESLGPYVLTIGEMAVTEVWVPESMVEDAVQVLLAAEIDHTLVVSPEEVADPWTLPMRLSALGVAGLVAWGVVRAVLRVF